MKSYKIYFKLLVIILILSAGQIYSQEEVKYEQAEIGITEKLGETLPDGIILKDENGNEVDVKTLIDKPTIFSLVYFRCPGICSPLLNGISNVVDKSDMTAGKDYNLITISFDQTEDYTLAAGKKESYLENLEKKIPADSWRFLTGDSANIKKITDALGFGFKKQDNDFIHGAAIMVVSPDGKIVRYLYSVEYLPFDFKMAVTEASEGKVVPSINRLMKMCFSFDPDGRRYVLNVTRVAGTGILLVLGVFFGVLVFKKKKNKENLNNI
ncbi:MAG: SCO family protein [Ignavibacteria bacterium]|jgi:protein SCO1/2|nr:SCO family protein [Ignavibacteria bacterium]